MSLKRTNAGDQVVSVRFPKPHYRELKECAGQAGEGISTIVRLIVIGELNRRRAEAASAPRKRSAA